MIIKVKNLRLRGILGVNSDEREKKQDLIVNYCIEINANHAVKTDSITNTFNYKEINKQIIKMVEESSYYLIETLVDAIANKIMTDPRALKVTVEVDKPHALRFADSISVEHTIEKKQNAVVLGIGSNINPQMNTAKAIKILGERYTIEKNANFIKTSPMLLKNQPDFLNGAVLIKTSLEMEEFKNQLKQIEKSLGRKRQKDKNSPREIDLDIIVWNDDIIDNNFFKWEFLKDLTLQLLPNLKYTTQ